MKSPEEPAAQASALACANFVEIRADLNCRDLVLHIHPANSLMRFHLDSGSIRAHVGLTGRAGLPSPMSLDLQNEASLRKVTTAAVGVRG